MVLDYDISSCQNNYLCQIIFKSHYAWQSISWIQTGFTEALAQSLSVNCDLDLWPSESFLFPTHCMPWWFLLLKFFINPTMHDNVMGGTQTGFTEAYAQSLRVDCDLDLWCSNIVLVCNKLSCHDDHLCQTIFKSHYAGWSYGLDRILKHTNEHTKTHKQGKLYMSFCHSMEGALSFNINVDADTKANADAGSFGLWPIKKTLIYRKDSSAC